MEWSGIAGGGFESVEDAPPISKSEYEFETQFLISTKVSDMNRTSSAAATEVPSSRFFIPMVGQQATTASYSDPSGLRGRKSDGARQFAATTATAATGTLRPIFDLPPTSFIRTKKGSEPDRPSDTWRHLDSTATTVAATTTPFRSLAGPQQIQKPHMEARNASALMWEVPERAGHAAMNALPTEWITRRRDPREIQSGSQE
jgi:hypothetical protein